MAAIQPTGSAGTVIPLFNSAILTIDNVEVAEIENVQVSETFDIKKTMGLNTIKARRIKRSNLQQEVTFEINSGLYTKVIELFYSSSSPVASATEYTINDGQQTTANVYITGYSDGDDTKPVQYQIQNPVFSSHSPNNQSQEFGTVSVSVACTEILLVVSDNI